MEIESEELYECPYCKSYSIEGEEADFESWVRVVHCRECGRHWQEYLKVYRVYIPLEYEEVYQASNPSEPEFNYNDFHELKPGDEGYVAD